MTIYILELDKTLGKEKELDDWIRVFKAKSEEELDMITTKNKSVLAAIKELKAIGLTNILREEYEFRLKAKRDARARESYVRKEGIAIGKAEGKVEDILELLAELGTVPEELKQIIVREKNLSRLSEWHKIAAKMESVEEFITKIQADSVNKE